MPTYDYVCDQCGYAFELFQKMTDPPEEVCPRCDGKLRRLIGTGAGILFKGSGFYITDYRSPDYKAKAKAETGSGGSTGSSGEAAKKPDAGGAGSSGPTKEAKPPAPKKEAGKD